MKDKTEIIEDDITTLKVDAVLCQANTDLEMTDEIPSTLLDKGGEEILDDCNSYEGLIRGSAILTQAGKIKNIKYIIHVILYVLGEEDLEGSEDYLMLGVRRALALAKEKELKNIAIPLLGSDQVGIPIKRAAELIMAEVKKHLDADSILEKVIFVANNMGEYDAFEEALKQM